MKGKVLYSVSLLVFIITIVFFYYIAKKAQNSADVLQYNYHIYVINLARRRDRMVKFGANYQLGPQYKILDAVDGKTLNLDDLVSTGKVGHVAVESIRNVETGRGRKHHYEIGTIGAIGCAMSHIKVWQEARMKETPTIVFEDDAIVSGIQMKEINNRIKSLPDDWHIYLLGRPHTMYTGNRVRDDLVKVQRFCGLHAYVINKNGADLLLEKGKLFPINQQVDSHLSELCLDYGLNVYSHTNLPMYFAGDNTTDIQVMNETFSVDDARLKIE